MQLDRGIDWLALTDLWVRLETRYKAENYDGLGGKSTAYVVDRGSPIVLVASHAVNHFRDRRPKLADRWTGGLTELLGELLDISVITATRKRGRGMTGVRARTSLVTCFRSWHDRPS